MAVIDGAIRCSMCGEKKPIGLFTAHYVNRGYGPCRQCRRKNNKAWRDNNIEKNRSMKASGRLRREYGLSVADRDIIFLGQGGKCACCGIPGVAHHGEIGRRLLVDHCHETKVVRGLLCWPCNIAIGLLGDTAEGVARALAYLNRSRVAAERSVA